MNEKSEVENTDPKAVKKSGRPMGVKNPKVRKSSPKAGAGKRYDSEIKAKILEAAKGKSIAEAHVAAVGVGYHGTAASLYQMLRNAGKKKSKPGRPKGSTNRARPVGRPPIAKRAGRPAKAAGLGGGLGAIDSIVSREVQGRINAAAKAAIAELQKLIK
jgi:hypothetical protein